MHEEGGDTHGIIYDSESYEVNSDEAGNEIGVFTSEANAADLDLRYKEKSSDGGDRTDDDAENNTNQSEELEPSRLENLLLYDSDDDLT